MCSRRQLIDAIRWRVRVGAPWRDVPARYRSWSAVLTNRLSQQPPGEVLIQLNRGYIGDVLGKALWVLAAALFGAGAALIFGSWSLVPTWMLVAYALLITAAGVFGAWRSQGTVGRGQRSSGHVWAGALVALVCLVVVPVVWGRFPPAVIAGCLLVLATGVLFIPIGLMGDDSPGDEPLGGQTATLLVSRPHDAGALLRRVWVTVDGRRVAALRRGQSAAVTIQTGQRAVQATLDWISSEPLTVHLTDKGAVSVEVSVPGRAYWQTWTRPSQALDIRISDA